jgi:hypothetical protein
MFVRDYGLEDIARSMDTTIAMVSNCLAGAAPALQLELTDIASLTAALRCRVQRITASRTAPRSTATAQTLKPPSTPHRVR